MDSIVFVVAHPDDVAFGMSGTALLLQNNYHLHVICATRGERGMPEFSLEETAVIREKEELNACELLGAKLTFLDLIDKEVFASKINCQKLAAIISEIDPMTIFTIWPVDKHPDHSAIAEMTSKAVALSETKAKLYFCEEGRDIQTTQFVPDIYIDITKVIDKKLELIRCHASQNIKDSLAQLAIRQFSGRGEECGCLYAEGFKSVENTENNLLNLQAAMKN